MDKIVQEFVLAQTVPNVLTLMVVVFVTKGGKVGTALKEHALQVYGVPSAIIHVNATMKTQTCKYIYMFIDCYVEMKLGSGHFFF